MTTIIKILVVLLVLTACFNASRVAMTLAPTFSNCDAASYGCWNARELGAARARDS